MPEVDGRRLAQWQAPQWATWVIPAVAAGVWSVVIGAAHTAATARSLVFVGGPLLLLAGLHARLTGYLHARARLQLLPLPIAASTHFAAARPAHLRGLAATVGLGTIAVALGSLGAPTRVAVGLVLDWLWLALIAATVEPAVAGASAYLGRRFTAGGAAQELQRRLGGGWTLPEAVIHLYAPAIGIGASAALAMPGQLLIDRVADGLPSSAGLAGVAAAGVALGAALGLAGRPAYGRGFFGAVPWVAEATRTLSGPPIPPNAPRWVARLRDPMLRLLVLSYLRESPLPMLRLVILAAATAWVGLRSASPDAPPIAVVAAAALLWLFPRGSARAAAVRERLTAPLPLRDIRRSRRRALALWLAPVVAGLGVLTLRWGAAW